MVRIAIVETYPYAAVWGGDAVYLDRIRQYLTSLGHSVDSYITDVTRGRSNPVVKLRTLAERNHRWILKNAVQLNADQFISCDLRLIPKIAARAMGRRAAIEQQIDDREQIWLMRKLRRSPPDLVILAFGACHFAKAMPDHMRTVALKGFFSDRRIRLGDGQEIAQPCADAALLAELSAADCVTFNNQLDLEFYQKMPGSAKTALIGIGFPDRSNGNPSAESVLIFVGANTKPNREALEWFIDGAWPLVARQAPDAKFKIAGAVGKAFEGKTFGNIEILGFCDDLDAEYGRAQLVVAPLITGSSGVKTKVAEALSYGLPVVTTSIGVDLSNPGQFRDAVDVADDPVAFAQAVVRLLTDNEYRRVRTRNAKAQFAQHFSESVAYRPLLRMLQP